MRAVQAEASLETDVARLKEQMRDVGASQQDAYRGVEACNQSVREMEARLDRELAELRSMIKALEAARVEDREHIVEGVKKLVGSSAKSSSTRAERGYEHTVEPGQTLSQIAAAYNVRVDAIVRANNLGNANAIRVGQVLFIPE
jgi:predicted  nucleic acid-binding Zn-ribbon protein